jgi:hypothetical protein
VRQSHSQFLLLPKPERPPFEKVKTTDEMLRMVGSKTNMHSGIIGSGGEMKAQSIQMVMNSRSQLSDASIDKVLMN